MKIVVFGAGAVGSLFGARLSGAGHAVELIGRPDHVAAIRAHGLQVVGRGEGVYSCRAEVTLPPETVADAVLVTVKTFDLPEAATEVARSLSRPVPALFPQNGLGIEAIARTALESGGWSTPERWMVRAVHSVPATWVAPGVVRGAGEGEILLPDPKVSAAGPHVPLFRELFGGASLPVRVVHDFDREVWRKVLVNAAINPVTAARGVTNGRLLEEPYRAEALHLLGEALRVADASGFGFSEREAQHDFERVVRATAENRSSMLQDLDRGRPTEIEAISGEILRVAAVYGIDLPATRAIVEEVRRRAAPSRARPKPS